MRKIITNVLFFRKMFEFVVLSLSKREMMWDMGLIVFYVTVVSVSKSGPVGPQEESLSQPAS